MGAPTLGPNDNDPRIALHEYWDRLKQLDAKIHLTFTSKFPRSMRVADWAIEHLYLCCASPTVALVVTFLLVPLVITDSISLITFISVSAAWLIAVLGIAKATWVNSLRISARLGILFISGLLMAVAGRAYIRFTLVAYAKNHTKEVASIPAPPATDSNSAIFDGLRKQLETEIQHLQKSKGTTTHQQPRSVPSLLLGMTDAMVTSRARDIGRQMAGIHHGEWHAVNINMSNREQTTLQRQQHQIGIHDKYLSQWKSIATEANLYRLAIRQRLMSSHPETDEDRKWDAYFTAQVSNPNDTAQLRNAANYLLAIATTLSPESN